MSSLSLAALLEFSKGQTSPRLSIQNAELIAPVFQLVKESINHLNEPFFFLFLHSPSNCVSSIGSITVPEGLTALRVEINAMQSIVGEEYAP